MGDIEHSEREWLEGLRREDKFPEAAVRNFCVCGRELPIGPHWCASDDNLKGAVEERDLYKRALAFIELRGNHSLVTDALLKARLDAQRAGGR